MWLSNIRYRCGFYSSDFDKNHNYATWFYGNDSIDNDEGNDKKYDNDDNND